MGSFSLALRRVVLSIAEHDAPSALSPVLSMLSVLYACLLHTQQRFIRPSTHSLPVPTISVGNLTWGGNGKTPLVEFLARRLLVHGYQPLVLSRGYGTDECRQIMAHVPDAWLGVGVDRQNTTHEILKAHGVRAEDAEARGIVALIDDGYQLRVLKRDIDIVTVNAVRPWGNGKLIPRGSMREPKVALRRANVCVLHHVDLISMTRKEEIIHELRKYLMHEAVLVESVFRPTHLYSVADPTQRLSVHKLTHYDTILALSAIGCPASFHEILLRAGAKCVEPIVYPDHFNFGVPKEMERILLRIRQHGCDRVAVVTTEKDFYRFDLSLWRDLLLSGTNGALFVLACEFDVVAMTR